MRMYFTGRGSSMVRRYIMGKGSSMVRRYIMARGCTMAGSYFMFWRCFMMETALPHSHKAVQGGEHFCIEQED